MKRPTEKRLHRQYPLSAAFLIALSFGMPSHSIADVNPSKDTMKLVQTLQSGGNVIYIRHTSTEKDYADQITAEVGNCSTQRTLSQQGWSEARLIGAAFDMLQIPVGAVFSSEYCRAWQTAELSFGRVNPLAEFNFEKAETYSKEQTLAMKSRVVPFLAMKPLLATNTIIVGHDDPFEAATGIYPEPQGVAYVLKPEGDGEFKVLGSIAPSQWPQLMGMLR